MTKTNMQALKPCPFCDWPGKIGVDLGSRQVFCDNATCNVRTPWYDTEEEAITAWNTRPIETNTRTGDTDGLVADMTRALPGGKMDDSTFSAIEDALDLTDAPSVIDGKWLTLVERIAALSTPQSITPEWCLKMAELEGDAEIGAGMPDHPLRQSITPPEGGELDRPFMLAAARVWWSRKMNSDVRNIWITGDGRVKVAWQDSQESGDYTLPVDFITALSTPEASDTKLVDALERAQVQFEAIGISYGNGADAAHLMHMASVGQVQVREALAEHRGSTL